MSGIYPDMSVVPEPFLTEFEKDWFQCGICWKKDTLSCGYPVRGPTACREAQDRLKKSLEEKRLEREFKIFGLSPFAQYSTEFLKLDPQSYRRPKKHFERLCLFVIERIGGRRAQEIFDGSEPVNSFEAWWETYIRFLKIAVPGEKNGREIFFKARRINPSIRGIVPVQEGLKCP